MSNCCLRGGAIAFLKYAPSQSSRCMATSVKVGGQLAKVAHLTQTSSNIFDDLLSARNPSHSAILDLSARFCRRVTGAPICNGLLKRRNGIAAVSNLQRTFSTTTKPFSRKKPAPKAPEIDASTGDIICEPLLSFNYQATLGIIQIARAVAPIVSMNEGFILTANYDLRTDGESLNEYYSAINF